MHEDIGRHILPIPDRAKISPPPMTRAMRKPFTSRSSRSGHRRARRTSSSSCSTMLGSARTARSAGPCRTPTFERLAANGLRYSRFHTTAICSPTRQALLTGRNHHSVGMGTVSDMATAAPGYTSVRPNTAATVAETLRLNGYSTAQFGKCHEVPSWEWSSMGPFDRWPTGTNGFEYFYGFIGGETSQFYPSLIEGTNAVEQDRTPEEGYHFTEDIATRARQLAEPATRVDAGQALLPVLRAGRDPRTDPRPRGVAGSVQRRVRHGLGRGARGDLRSPEAARRDPA